MTVQVTEYKNLDAKFKAILNQDDFDPTRMIYLVKDNSGNVKSLTTSVFEAIKKVKAQ